MEEKRILEEDHHPSEVQSSATYRAHLTPRQMVLNCLRLVDSTEKMMRGGSYMQPRPGFKDDVSRKIIESLQEDPTLAGEVFDFRDLDDSNEEWPGQWIRHGMSKPLMHWACHYGLSLDLIQHIHGVCPSACQVSFSTRAGKEVQTNGLLPVQEALYVYAYNPGARDIATIQYLLDIYPESATTELLERLITVFPLTQSTPLLQRFLSNEDDLRTITKSVSVPWSYPHTLPVDLLEWIAKLHHQSSFSIVAKVASGSSFWVEVTEGNGLVVELQCDESLTSCMEQLLQVPDLPLRAIEIQNMDHVPSLYHFIAALTYDASRFQDPLAAMLMDPQTLSFFARMGIPHEQYTSTEGGQSNPDEGQDQATDFDTSSSRLDFSSVERLKINSVIRGSDIMDELLDAIVTHLPNLRILQLDGHYNLYEGLSDIPSSGFVKLPDLADRLVELEVSCHPLAITSMIQLMKSSTTLKKLSFLDSCKRGYILDNDQSTQFARALQQQTADGGYCSLEELFLECRFKDEVSFETKLVNALESNTTLKTLQLPELQSSAGKSNIGENEKENTGMSSIIDLLRQKKNITLQDVVVKDLGRRLELQFWCEMNHVEPLLQKETISVRDAISIIAPYLSPQDCEGGAASNTCSGSRIVTSNTDLHPSIVYGLIRSRPDLWKPE